MRTYNPIVGCAHWPFSFFLPVMLLLICSRILWVKRTGGDFAVSEGLRLIIKEGLSCSAPCPLTLLLNILSDRYRLLCMCYLWVCPIYYVDMVWDRDHQNCLAVSLTTIILMHQSSVRSFLAKRDSDEILTRISLMAPASRELQPRRVSKEPGHTRQTVEIWPFLRLLLFQDK